MSIPRPRILPALALLTLSYLPSADAGPITFLGLGDSLTFGVGADDTPADISNGDRGYVALVADALAAGNGGIRPEVINLAVSGETTASFFGEGVGIRGPDSAAEQNYPQSGPLPTQDDLLLGTLSARGADIRTIALTLGSNDLFAIAPLMLGPGLTDAEKQALVQSTLSGVGTNIARLLAELRGAQQAGVLSPGASIFVLGTYDPFPAVPAHPVAPLAGVAIPLLNDVIHDVADLFGATYVDIATPFIGHEAEFTYITTSGGDFNVHPTAAGYRAIAAQVVPEPSTLALAGMGGVGMVAYRGRRKRARHGQPRRP